MTDPARLPPTYLVTPEPLAEESLADFVAHLERTLEAGIRLVQLRAKTLAAPQYAELDRKSVV